MKIAHAPLPQNTVRPEPVEPKATEGQRLSFSGGEESSASTSSARTVVFSLVIAMLLTTPALAKDRLGAWQSWAAFRDTEIPRCYAIGGPEETSGSGGYLSIGFWPKRGLSHQVYVRLSRTRGENSGITLSAAGRRFRLIARGNSGFAKDRQMDMAILAAIRSAQSVSVQSVDRNGRNIIDAYATRGAASAIDAAALGCARSR
ncbi:MAG: hypothetical protein ACRCY3_16965 [Sphingorhabdus sp.]